jgi:hypothetical protein
MTAAVAPGGIMDERINDGVKSAVLTAVDNIMDEVRPRVQETVDNIFVSYCDCVLSERSEAELALAAHQSLVETGLQTSVGTIISDFQQFVDASNSVNITKLEEAVHTATTAFDARRTLIVESINTAHRASNIRPPAIPHVHLAQSPRTILDDAPAAAQLPPPTGLELLLDNAAPMGASRAAHASTAAYAPGDHAQHGGPRLPDRSLWTPPVNPYGPSDTRDSHHLRGAPTDNPCTPYFASGSRVPFNGESSGRYGGAYTPHDFCESDFRNHTPSPSSGPRSPPGSDDSSDEYHSGQHGIPDDCKMSALFLANLGFQNKDIQNKIMRVFRHTRLGWYNRQYNSFGPQKESILKSTAFSSRLLLEKFDAPSVVNWYERLTRAHARRSASALSLSTLYNLAIDRTGSAFPASDSIVTGICKALSAQHFRYVWPMQTAASRP